jgi:hypothetical protein
MTVVKSIDAAKARGATRLSNRDKLNVMKVKEAQKGVFPCCIFTFLHGIQVFSFAS